MTRSGNVEYIVVVTRIESQRLRMKRVTDKGTQIALVMPRGSHLRDGDVVFLTSEKSGGARGVGYSAVFTQESY